VATGSKDQPWAAGARPQATPRPSADRRSPSWSLIVGGLVIVAAVVALLAYGRAVQAPRDVNATASAPVTTSPPTDHPAVTEPSRPTPLPAR
jgi:hypothetical protein